MEWEGYDENFDCSIQTEVFFGEGRIEELSRNIKKYGSRVLITYGGGSVKRTGLLDRVKKILEEDNIFYLELGGIKPNPRIDSVRQGVRLCRENKLDFILAVGGGSTIDCSKAISVGCFYPGDPWDLVLGKASIKEALPLGTILTMAATGSEMNKGAVISNMETNQKLGFGHSVMGPKFSILDPKYTYTLPKEQTMAGIVDIMSHTFEGYFNRGEQSFISDRLSEAILKTCIKYGPILLDNPEDYEARSNIMWASSLALNGLLSFGKDVCWSVHPMEHELSAFYDITHGVGLAILTPRWMEYVLDENSLDKFVEYGVNVWDIDNSLDKKEIAGKSIEATFNFFKSLGVAMSLREVGIDNSKLELMAEALIENKGGNIEGYRLLDKDAILEIYKKSL